MRSCLDGAPWISIALGASGRRDIAVVESTGGQRDVPALWPKCGPTATVEWEPVHRLPYILGLCGATGSVHNAARPFLFQVVPSRLLAVPDATV